MKVERELVGSGRSVDCQVGCCINTIRPPDDEHTAARNMYRNIIIKVLRSITMHQVGHLLRMKNIFLTFRDFAKSD